MHVEGWVAGCTARALAVCDSCVSGVGLHACRQAGLWTQHGWVGAVVAGWGMDPAWMGGCSCGRVGGMRII